MPQAVMLKKLKLKLKLFYEDLQDLLELTPQKDVLFIIWAAAAAAKSLSRV